MFLNNNGEFDASLKIKDTNNCIFLQTDNLINKKEALRIAKIDKIDIAFVIPFLSGVFPGFYKWDTDTLIKLSNEKIDKSLNYCSDIVKALKPKFTIPYACDLGYLGDNFHINLIHRNNKHDLIREEDIAQVKVMPRLPRPIELHMDKRWKFPMMRFEEMLRYHPEVRLSLRDRSTSDIYLFEDNESNIKHIFHMNWHGRYLLDRPNVPLSIWPLVLEKVNDNDRVEDKASILYGLLQGPAGAQRTNFERRVD